MKQCCVVVVSGLSGSGKTNALKCFEDIGFFCVDNLPLPLLPKFIELCEDSRQEMTRVALGIDIRERDFLGDFFVIFDHLKEEGYQLDLVFLEAQDEVLVRRFSETRRPHPLAFAQSVVDAVRWEREKLADLRLRANRIIDTSYLTVRQLKEIIGQYFLKKGDTQKLRISLVSFGYKNGLPFECDLLFDVRFLTNPNFVADLKPLTGEHPRVSEFVLKSGEASLFLEKMKDFLSCLVPLYEKEGRSYLTIGVGCTGGRHRSVAIVNEVGEYLRKMGHEVIVRHRDRDR